MDPVLVVGDERAIGHQAESDLEFQGCGVDPGGSIPGPILERDDDLDGEIHTVAH